MNQSISDLTDLYFAAMGRPTPTWPDQRGAYGIAGPDGPSSAEMSGARWAGLPISSNVEDRRGDSRLLSLAQLVQHYVAPNITNYGLDQVKEIFEHPFTPRNQIDGKPLMPEGPLSREAGYDDIMTNSERKDQGILRKQMELDRMEEEYQQQRRTRR